MGKKEGATTDEKGKQGFGRSAAAFGAIGVGAFLLQLQKATSGRGIRPWDDSIRLSLLWGLELAGRTVLEARHLEQLSCP